MPSNVNRNITVADVSSKSDTENLIKQHQDSKNATKDEKVVEKKQEVVTLTEVSKETDVKESKSDDDSKESKVVESKELTTEDNKESKTDVKVNPVDKRIGRLVKERSDLQRQLQEALHAVERLTKGQSGDQNNTSKQLDDEPKRPRRTDFEDPDSYDSALEKWSGDVKEWSANKTKKELVESERQKALQDQARVTQELWQKKIDLGAEKYDDFDEVVFSDDIPISNAMSETIKVDLDNGEDVAYYLGKNISEAKDIFKMSERSQVVALTKLSNKLIRDAEKAIEAEASEKQKEEEAKIAKQKEDEEKKRVKEEEAAKKKLSNAVEPHKPTVSNKSGDVVDLDSETPEQYRKRRLTELNHKPLR